MLVKCLNREDLTVSNSVKSLTSAKYANNSLNGTIDVQYVDITVTLANIRAVYTGVTADNPVAATTGTTWYVGGTYRVWGRVNMAALRMIRDTATDAAIACEYWGREGG